jgi:hypothetical protein
MYLHIGEILCHGIFCILLFYYLPTLAPYSGYILVEREACIEVTMEYAPLPAKEQIFLEWHVCFFSRIFFEFMTSLVKVGDKIPIREGCLAF